LTTASRSPAPPNRPGPALRTPPSKRVSWKARSSRPAKSPPLPPPISSAKARAPGAPRPTQAQPRPTRRPIRRQIRQQSLDGVPGQRKLGRHGGCRGGGGRHRSRRHGRCHRPVRPSPAPR
jgi:hypothetical protein